MTHTGEPQLTTDHPLTLGHVAQPPRASVRRMMQLRGLVSQTVELPTDLVLALSGQDLCTQLAEVLGARIDTLRLELSAVVRSESGEKRAALEISYVPDLFANHTRLDAYERLADRYDSVVELKFGGELIGHYFSPEGLQIAQVHVLISWIDRQSEADQNSLSLVRQELQQSLDDGDYFAAVEQAEIYLSDYTQDAFSTRRVRPTQEMLSALGIEHAPSEDAGISVGQAGLSLRPADQV